MYNSKSIKILSDDEIIERFNWIIINKISIESHTNLGFVERLFELANLSGVDFNWLVQKYIYHINIPSAVQVDLEALQMIYKEMIYPKRNQV